MLGEHAFDLAAVGEVGLDELKAVVALQLRKPGVLEIDVVIVVDVVEADDLVAARQQGPGGLRADETGDAGYEHLHSKNLPTRRRAGVLIAIVISGRRSPRLATPA